ncbi:MAG: hypothetical protein FWD15_02450 [Alphaproteobacteria bacterium]|nr:hypothetical protein [Alphaproteobacteria bacterium]
MENEYLKLWATLERLASPTELAKLQSKKRYDSDGTPRFPSMELISKTLHVSGSSWAEFAELMDS